MADAAQITQLRRNIGDTETPQFYTDPELGALLDAVDGVEPRARVAALRPLVAKASDEVQFADADYSEHAEQRYEAKRQMLQDALAEVAVLDAQDAATARGTARRPTRVAVEYVF